MRGYLRLLAQGVFLGALVVSMFAAAEDGRQDDPLESYNRAMFTFNDTADRWILKPIARGYHAVMPDPVERGVIRMFANVGEILKVVNNVLQGKVGQAGNNTGRFVVNTTVGLIGFFDVAQHMGLQKSEPEDFGQTFGVWGVPQGSYLVMPFIGPSSYRHAPGQLLTLFLDPIGQIDHVPTRNQIYAIQIISERADLLKAEELISGDKYSFVRDVYLQRREYLIMDGQVEDDFGDDEYE
ncbi:MAG: VacJ family lipoprotein [Gammaproteobacteria bacterium]|nr:MAG: VacJ family lipoprotein [Gammaproteobacteria bacterium]RLA48984.1 MAG: VacJ family lipoprotein [Gammaproteobacteria bacterium]